MLFSLIDWVLSTQKQYIRQCMNIPKGRPLSALALLVFYVIWKFVVVTSSVMMPAVDPCVDVAPGSGRCRL